MKEWRFRISFSGDDSAGLLPFSDLITVTIDSGDPGGEPGEFEEFMITCLHEWYDVAKVTSD